MVVTYAGNDVRNRIWWPRTRRFDGDPTDFKGPGTCEAHPGFYHIYTHTHRENLSPPASLLTTTMGVSGTVFCLLLLSCVANSGDDLFQQFFRQRKNVAFYGVSAAKCQHGFADKAGMSTEQSR